MLGYALQLWTFDTGGIRSMRVSRTGALQSGSTPPWSMTSPHLSLKLRDALGSEAGEELVATVDRAVNDISALRGDVAELRHQMELGFAHVDTRFANLDKSIEKQASRLILWSFGFWVTTLAGLAALLLTRR
jgi:hypothetical protein